MSAQPWPKEWVDTGCHLAPSCLDCPLPQCAHDLPYGAQLRENTRRRDLDWLPVALALPTAEAAQALGVTERTIYRVRERATRYS